MGSMKDLLGDTPASPYPMGPGYTNKTTSRAAADRVAPRAGSLRARVLDVYRHAADQKQLGLTADEVARALGESILTIRPRVTELGKAGWIVDTGAVRMNESRTNATVWKLNPVVG